MIKLSKIFLTQKTKHMGKSMNSPTRLKLPVFRGEKNWDSFTFQFERQVRHYNGRSEWRALINCLHDKALDFALELIQFKMQLCQSFEEDVKAIQNMRGTYFCQTPITVCSTKKGVKFWVFTRVHFLPMDGLPEANDSIVNQMVVDTFRRGCKDKKATVTP